MFTTDTALPVWVRMPFHRFVMTWLPGKAQVSVQPLIAVALLLVMTTLAVKPEPQSFWLV